MIFFEKKLHRLSVCYEYGTYFICATRYARYVLVNDTYVCLIYLIHNNEVKIDIQYC